MRYHRVLLTVLLFAVTARLVAGAEPKLAVVSKVEWQPFSAQIRRLIEATDYLGVPLQPADRDKLEQLLTTGKDAADSEAAQAILDAYCLLGVDINPESRVKVAPGRAKPELVEQGWRTFLVKVQNEAGVTAELQVVSPQARSGFSGGSYSTRSDHYFRGRTASAPADPWLDLQLNNSAPLKRELDGSALEYHLLQLYSRDTGQREAKLQFNVGQGSQDIGFRNDADILFTARPSRMVKLRVRDENDRPTTAAFIIRDRQGNIHPSLAKRLAPDFSFHPQIYRADGESLRLPDGVYTVECARGPESQGRTQTLTVDGQHHEFSFRVERWIDPALSGWWSGDHHIHAAGCAHYTKPSEGVLAGDMMRHCLGEDLKIGANLTWGPCFDFQKQFFTGQIDKVSQYPYLLRYDVEVSGFGSHNSGHLCLLRLREQMYPGGESKDHWPTEGLNTLRWAKRQGAVVGPAHSGWGLEVATAELPNYVVPPFNGIGANEYIVDVTHLVPGPGGELVPAVDFMSTVDTPYVWELNMWYHTLNAGFRTRISGETDFPCIYGERVGLGRSYVKLEGKLDYDQWCEGIRQGRNYVGDGRSHLMDFRANDVLMGFNGSELRLAAPGEITLTANVAARLNDQPNPQIKALPYDQKPYWAVERARIAGTGRVPVEVIVNGYPVSRTEIDADGRVTAQTFSVKITRSSWVALRILPSSHTNPIFVLVDGQPIRAAKRSVEWCLQGVDRCWSQKERFLKPAELAGARADYEHARQVYRQRISECATD